LASLARRRILEIVVSDYYEDLANEMARTERYIQPDEEEDDMSKYIYRSRIDFKRKPLVTEEQLMEQEDLRSPYIYQEEPYRPVPVSVVVLASIVFVASVCVFAWLML
jgi:hypothetical protein